MANYNELVQTAIRKEKQEAEEKRARATVTDNYNGQRIETVFVHKNKAVWQQIFVDGVKTSESRVYSIDERPYTRDFGKRWYIEGEYLKAMQAAI